MAAGVRKFPAVFESTKHPTGLGCRGTGGVYFNEFAKERTYHHNSRPVVSGLREAKLPHVSSALFDLELGEGDEDILASREKSGVVHDLETLVEPGTPLEQQVANDVQFLMLRHGNRNTGKPFDVSNYDQSQLAADLQALGYTVSIRRSVGGGSGAEGMNNLNHSFLRCTPPGASEVFIVDPKFRDQFDIMYSTASYRRVLDSIPPLLVVQEDKISAIVELLCEEMASSFKSTETPLPPWRRRDSLLSKWQPRRSMDVAVQKHPAVTSDDTNDVFGRSAPMHIPKTMALYTERRQQKVEGLHGRF